MDRRRFLTASLSGVALTRATAAPAGQPARLGSRYERVVPATLDLAERARSGLRHFDRITDERLGYEMFTGAFFNTTDPPTMYPHVTSLAACQPKALEAIAFERLMCGSTENLERESRMVEMMVSQLGYDGLYWVTPDLTRKPWMKISEPFAMVHGQGRMLRAMIAWYQATGAPVWRERIDRLVEGLEKLVVDRDDYAYIPVRGFFDGEYLRSCYTRRGWKDRSEPPNEKFGEEGSLFNHQGHIPGALATWYILTGNERALRLSGRLCRFYTKPQFWADWKGTDYPIVNGAEHAHWQGHFHGHVNTLRAVLEYGIATNDARLKSFARDGYEWARQKGMARIGYFDHQGCGCGRMIGLAVKLSYHGIGDYWEDVDQYIRNHGTEMQFVPEDRDFLMSLSRGRPAPKPSPGEITDDVLDRVIGGFSGQTDKCGFFICCSTHGNMGLFYAWDGTLRHSGGTVRVNLLLNRASPWLDVDSYLPYEGKAVLRNKSARELFVRVPLWADRKAVRCRLGSREVSKEWFGSYLRVAPLEPSDVITLTFQIVDRVERWTIPRVAESAGEGEKLYDMAGRAPEQRVHTCRFKGNTLVEISPPLMAGSPLYQGRQGFLKNEAPMTRVTRFASPLTLQW